MKNVLIWGDNPTGITGFGKVIKNIIRQVYDKEKYEINVIGISYLGDPYERDNYNGQDILYDMFSPFEAGRPVDLYGGGKVETFLRTNKVDILFILQDTFIMRNVIPKVLEVRESLKNKFVIIYYYPIDSHWIYPDWIQKSVSLVDIPVCYTEFGKRVSIKHDHKLKDMRVLYHGTDKSIYKPMDKEAISGMRTTFWGDGNAEKFIILNINRNQPRKDLTRTFAVFSKMKEVYKDAFLYCLSNPGDIGGNIIDIALQFGLEWGKDWFSPDPTRYNPMLGFPEHQVSMLYNLSDVCISTTLGEGWGFSLTEAMACKCPVIFPDNTSIREIIGKDEGFPRGIRGTLVPSGGTELVCLGSPDNNLVRPQTNIQGMVDELVSMAKNRNNDLAQYKIKVEKAISWVPSWEDIGVEWRKIFEEACVIHENGEEEIE